MQCERKSLVFGGDGSAFGFGDQRDVFASAVFEHLADYVAGEIALAAAQLQRDVRCGRAAIADRKTHDVESLCARVGGGDFAGLGIGVDGKGELFEGEVACNSPSRQ